MTPQRIMILGGPGSGKSTLARHLGETLGLPIIHLDAVFWRPGWVEPDKAAFVQEVATLAQEDCWVMDGNYTKTWPARMARADTVIFLDVSLPRRLLRVLQRTRTYRDQTRPDLAPDCPEKIDLEFLRYIIAYGSSGRLRALRLLDKVRSDQTVVRAQSAAEVIASLRLEPPSVGSKQPQV